MSGLSRNEADSYMRLASESADHYGRHYQNLHKRSLDSFSDETAYFGMPGLGDLGMLGGHARSTQSFDTTFTPTPSTRRLIGRDASSSLNPQICLSRRDDTGPWNLFSAWYIFLVHVCASAALFTSLIYIDGQQFLIGSGGYFDSPLHQAQVNGLLSFALVLIRIIAGCCSTLLSWRIVYILLEKSSISLVELTRLTGWRIPILTGSSRKSSLLWIVWASTATLLLWPQSFAAPFASSSISWIPGKRMQNETAFTAVPKLRTNMSGLFADLGFDTKRYNVILDGAASNSKNAEYFFGSTGIKSTRYFNATKNVPSESKINIRAPYFDVKVKWVDASNLERHPAFKHAFNQSFVSVNTDSSWVDTKDGVVYIVRSSPWSDSDLPNTPSVFLGTLPFIVNLAETHYNDTWWDGTEVIANKTTCNDLKSPYFKVLPNVKQINVTFYTGYGNDAPAVGNACRIGGVATITAGAFEAKDCLVSSSGNEYATCSVGRNNAAALEADWLSSLALDFVSDILEFNSVLNNTGFWISDDLTEYAEGMLTYGYNAAWNALMTIFANETEPATFKPSEPIVAAAVERSKLYIWLGMNAGVTISSIVVFWMQCGSCVKTIRNTELAALTIDLTEISHSGLANGLCNAAALNSADRKLPKMQWAENAAGAGNRESGIGHDCRRRVRFSEDKTSGDTVGTPLVSLYPNKYRPI